MALPILPYVPQSASAVSIEVQRLAQDHVMRTMAPHGHMFFELIVVIAGNGRHIVDGLDHEALAGTVFVLPPGSIHDLRSFASADGWAILFQTDSVDPDSPHGLAPIDNLPVGLLFDLFRQPVLQMLRPIQLDALSLAQVTGLIGRMHDELNGRQEGYVHAARAALQLLLVTLARNAPWLGAGAPNTMQQADLVSTVFADIDRHFRGASLLSQASSRLGFSGGYLTTKLRRLTGRTYGEWVIERRMIEARRLLATTQMSVADIAQALGYAEVESFIRRFRLHHEFTPSAWRERSRTPTPRESEIRTVKT
ncbi:hypothetical protein PATSB16_37280 [Pandoraea thiooxydans]|uniref:HTH araC/xylS-type domain-containing protein n=1 Tax=Pandoraea thiooxydans TaxID=445709 RepID=A0A0U3VA13_9BURK|nr:AraC family transcriptional regulator [Pandoraea thiooxydans]ALX34814.1 hypothetical protein ABW99_20765 [Pandoraea thiooxydans]APR97062.1 hypothetical protein PATSB16_37280 [Pandoraea thiooxydans]